jgi:hypothetical protein
MSALARRCFVVSMMVACLAFSCSEPPTEKNAVQPLEPLSLDFLRQETDDALKQLEAIKSQKSVPAAVTSAVDQSEERLRRLNEYYVPMLEARQHALGAELYWQAGETEKAAVELDGVEKTLVAVSQHFGEPVESSLRETVDAVTDARLALGPGAVDVAARMRRVTNLLGERLLKGRVVLSGEEAAKESKQ